MLSVSETSQMIRITKNPAIRHCERAARARQSTIKESQKGIPTRSIASRKLAMTLGISPHNTEQKLLECAIATMTNNVRSKLTQHKTKEIPMQIAIKGLTNDYAQYLQDKLDARRPKLSEKELQEMRIRRSSYAELQEAKANPQGEGTFTLNKETIEMALHLGGIIGNINSYQYSNPYTSLNIVGHKSTTEMGDRSTIDTPLGEMRIGVRLDEKTTLYLDNLAQLAAFDTNNDGLLTSNDLSAKNLILIGYDKDGAEIEMSLLDMLGAVELTQFFNYPKNGIKDSFAAISVSYTKLRAHETSQGIVCRLVVE
ncbi:MAG: hypothetical protein K2N70_02910, partial [Helicobacter sp.]|nr:hypothetical protein [Helicobacter sp.]